MKIKLCRTPTCDGTVTERSKSGLCSKCSSSLNYWNHHKARTNERLHKLQFWQGRLTFFVKKIIGHKKGK